MAMGEWSRLRVTGISLALTAAMLAGCARTQPPAPVDVRGAQRFDRVAPAASVTNTTTPGVAIVQPGDTLFGLARRNNVPVRALIDANKLEAPYVLHPGQRLVVPQVRTYVVQSGDTVSGVSRRFGIDTSALVRANGIQPPYSIQTGQVLVLPGAAPSNTPAATVVAAVPQPSPSSVGPVAAVPRGSVESASLPPVAMSRPAVEPAAPAPAPTHVPPAPTAPPATEAPVAEPTEVVAVDAVPQARAGRGFQWPVRGRVVSDFGAKGGGMHNDGINIAAPQGAPIHAAENGVVVYAGNELRGFGNLLLLRHADGWMTAYAHADELLVARGAQVKRGQVIARVGATGNVNSPQLHFEVRRGKRPVNPRDYLAAQSADAGG